LKRKQFLAAQLFKYIIILPEESVQIPGSGYPEGSRVRIFWKVIGSGYQEVYRIAIFGS
jgi:hypothetical protein